MLGALINHNFFKSSDEMQENDHREEDHGPHLDLQRIWLYMVYRGYLGDI